MRHESTSHTATICASASRKNPGRLAYVAWRPVPIIPIVIRLPGDTLPFAPSTRPGMINGAANVAPSAVAARFKKVRRGISFPVREWRILITESGNANPGKLTRDTAWMFQPPECNKKNRRSDREGYGPRILKGVPDAGQLRSP